MTTVRFFFEGERIGPKFERINKKRRQDVIDAVRGAANEVAEQSVREGRHNIASAPGKFGPRWTAGLNSTVTEGGGSIRVALTHDISYFMVHQQGATIRGRPWLYFKPTPGFVKGDPELIRKRSVIIPKRFRVLEVARDVARRFPDFFKRRMGGLR